MGAGGGDFLTAFNHYWKTGTASAGTARTAETGTGTRHRARFGSSATEPFGTEPNLGSMKIVHESQVGRNSFGRRP